MGNQVAEEDFYKRLSRFKSLALLIGVFLIAFSIVYLSHGPRLSDPDAWFQYRMAKYVIEEGGVPEVYPLAYYPEGRRPWEQDTLLLPYFFAYTFKIAEFFGVSTMKWAMMFPAIFGGGFAAVFLCLAAKELFNARVGFLSGLFYSFIPLNITRVYSGTIDKEVLYGFFVFPALYFFLKAYKTKVTTKEPLSLVYPVLGGIFYGLAYANWSGGAYILLVIALSIVLYSFIRLDTNLFKILLIMSLVGPMVMKTIQPLKYSLTYFIYSFPIMATIAVAFLPLFAITASNFIREKHNKDVSFLLIMAAAAAGIAGLLFAMGKGGLLIGLIKAFIGLLTMEKVAQQNIYMATVAESQPSSLFGPGDTIAKKISNGDFYINLRLILLVLPPGILLLLMRLRQRKDFLYILALIWIVSGFVAALQGKRLLFFLAPSASTVAAFTFVYVYQQIIEKHRKYEDRLKGFSGGKEKYQAERGIINVRAGFVLLGIIIFGTTIHTANVTASIMGARESNLSPPWYEALMWTKENTPENAVIFFWWDYGYYFQAVADRYTVADGGGNVPRNIVLANMFTSPEEEAMKYIKRFVDYEKVPTYMVVSYEEFGKSGAINRIAAGDPDHPDRIKSEDGQLYITSFRLPKSGSVEKDMASLEEIFKRNQISTYYIIDIGKDYLVWVLIQVDKNGKYHPEWADKLLVKLLPFNNGLGKDLKHFELVYQDRWGYVFIYRVK
jgi:dolichyl-diphosphooligosaccharide--protein glycosyltransferase